MGELKESYEQMQGVGVVSDSASESAAVSPSFNLWLWFKVCGADIAGLGYVWSACLNEVHQAHQVHWFVSSYQRHFCRAASESAAVIRWFDWMLRGFGMCCAKLSRLSGTEAEVAIGGERGQQERIRGGAS